jgi:dipeptidyl aminopeptidase/acylaminoacyl peptidase
MFDQEKKPVLKDDAVIGLLGGNSEEKHTEAVAASPVTYVTKDDPPFITFHGSADQRVAYLHAEAIHAALQKASVPSLLIPITNGGHGSVSHPEVIARAKLFVGKTLLGADTTIDTAPIPALPEKKKP